MKKSKKVSVSEDEEGSQVVNENGKRPADDGIKEGPKRMRTKSLYRQPTVRELNRLQETENLFNSNLFRLQIEEVLEEVKIKEKTEKKFQEWFSNFKTHLDSIPEDETEYDLTEHTFTKKLKVKLPISAKLMKTKCVFKFHKFNNVEIIGSYALGCSINSKLRIDVQITVPAETYTKNDSINYRYHKKRAAYLAYIASHLKNLEIVEEITYTWPNGSETRPVIDIKPTGKNANHFSVRLHLVCEEEAYKLQRFSPLRNNLRESWVLDEVGQENTNEVGPPTPYYNSSVLTDLTAKTNQEFLNVTFSNTDNLKQAIVLLKIWLRQRNLQVSGFVVSLYVAYLVEIKRINNIMSSYQIVRNVWVALKSSEWDTKGLTLHKGDNAPQITDFLQHFPIVFLDKTGYYNLCWDMCKGTYAALKRECALAVDMLDNSKINSFIPLFMVPFKPLSQFDYILRFKNLPKLKESIITRAPKEARVNYGVDHLQLVTDNLYSLLAKGLGDRADLILQMVEADFSWSCKKTPEKAREISNNQFEEKLSFGFILNPENALNVIQKGPPANLPEAEEFRSFWGDKSELRRFQDGSITETCVWEGDSMLERRGLTRQILEYLLQLKYEIPPSDLFHIYDQLDSLLLRKQYCSDSESASTAAVRAFDELRRDLRGLTQLPLDVSAVYGVSEVLSYCAPLPPLPCPCVTPPRRRGLSRLIKDVVREDGTLLVPDYTPVCKAVIELGHSGKWPGDLEAFRCLKSAFHLQLATCLQTQYSLPVQAYHTHVDVLKHGLVFRLEIAHPKEITLLRREIENGVVKYRDTDESIQLQCDTVLMPRLRGALHGLHQKHPSFGPVSCLLKRFLSSHLLSPPHFPSIVCDLMTSSVYLRPEPLEPPVTCVAGFVRVLRLLANTDWDTEMIVLDFNDDMKREEITELEQKFNSRPSDASYMHIVTSYDGELSGVWSRGVSKQVALRARALASTTLQYIERKWIHEHILNAFIPSYVGFDVLISLHCTAVPHTAERVDRKPQYKHMPENIADDLLPVVEFNVVDRYLSELRLEIMPSVDFNVLKIDHQPLTELDRAILGREIDYQLSRFLSLHCNAVPHTAERVDRKPQYKHMPEHIADDLLPVVEFNVVDRYLSELRSAYSEWALFFHDCFGGDVIAVLWKPDLTQDREFQISNANALKPVVKKGETKYKINIPALIEDFRIIGKGLVKDITVTT